MSNFDREREGTKNGLFIVIVILVIALITISHSFV